MKVLDLAEYVIRRADVQGKLITNLKLQKTLYYLQGYSLKEFEKVAFEEDIQNWQYGPVTPVAYFAYSKYGSEPLELNENRAIENPDNKHATLFNEVIDGCLKLSARTLVEKTHKETPWKKTLQNQEITVEIISEFFSTNDPLGIEGMC